MAVPESGRVSALHYLGLVESAGGTNMCELVPSMHASFHDEYP